MKEKKIENRNICYHFEIISNQICHDLSNYNIVPRKTFVVKLPNINDEYFGDYLRGLFDGDGHVGICYSRNKFHKNVTIVSGSVDFLKAINRKLDNLGSIYKSRNGKSYCLKFNSKKAIKKLFDTMYKNKDNSLYLERKYDVFIKMFELNLLDAE